MTKMATLTSVGPKVQYYWHTLSQNPVAVKELRSRMRGRRAFAVLTAYLFFMMGLVSLVYHSFYASQDSAYGPEPALVGKAVLACIVIVQGFLVVFGTPSFTSAAIIGEKERQTYDLLRTTSLPAEQLVQGKLLSALSYVLLLVFASIPLESIAFLLGGVSLSEIVISQLLLVAAAVTFALIGLWASTVARSVQAANGLANGATAILLFGVPALAFLLGFIFRNLWDVLPEVVTAYLLLLVVSTNLPVSLILSEVMLLEEGTLWAFKNGGASGFWILSPWYLHLLFNIILSFLLYRRIVYRIQQIPDK
jgi:ABC-type transport system involved in multi-copper enzyme maturation permease subunit